MRIQIHSHGLPLTADGRAYCEGRAADALGGLPVAKAVLFVADENGPKGGPDKTCTLLVRLTGGKVVTVARRATGLPAAVTAAADTAAAAVRRWLARRRDSHRQPEGTR